METKIENVFFGDNQTEQTLVIRHDEAKKVYQPVGVRQVNLTIDSVVEYLRHPGVDASVIEGLSFVLFNYKNRFVELVYNYRNEFLNGLPTDDLKGVLKLHPDLESFKINSNERVTSLQLSQFIRMHKHFFEVKDQALKLSKDLQDFKVKIDKEIQQADDRRGNATFLIAQKIITSMPLEFTILVPVFVGEQKVPIKIEIDIDASDLSCSLVSPELKELIDVESKRVIDIALAEIKELQPMLRIFESNA